jgi:hypothetical protein
MAINLRREIELMMCDDNFYVCRQQGYESRAQFCELLAVDPAVLAGKRTGRVDAGDGNLVVDIERLQIL